MFTPVKILRTTYGRLSNRYRDAVLNATDWFDDIPDNQAVRIETYRMDDVQYWVKEVCRWPVTLEETESEVERSRVRTIMEAIRREGQWPYVSYWAQDMKELLQVDEEPDGEMSVPNHGDGWHRIIANVELGLPTLDVLFFGTTALE